MLDIIWDQKYSVQIAELDQQHQKFTALLDLLFEAIEAGRSQSMLGETLLCLATYANYHFDSEEQLMIKHRYPELGVHQAEHDGFRAKVLEFRRSFAANKETLTGDVVKFMTHWIADHVTNTDMKYMPFLKERGVF